MGSISDFYILDGANEGTEIPLETPDGKKEEWIRIRSRDSEAYQTASLKARRERLAMSPDATQEEKDKQAEKRELDLYESLVIGWSFKEECNPVEIRKMLVNAPQIVELISNFSMLRALFTKKKLKPLSSSPKEKSSSKKSPKAKS